MKKILISVFVLMLTFLGVSVAYSTEKKWLEISKNIFINDNMARFITDTNYQIGLIEYKIIDSCNNNKCTIFGLYYVDCLKNTINIGEKYIYNSKNELIKKEKPEFKSPITSSEKIIFQYMCKDRRDYMLRLENELLQLKY